MALGRVRRGSPAAVGVCETRRYTEAREVSHLLHFHDALPREHAVWPGQEPEQAPNSVTLREQFAKSRVHGNLILGGQALESVTILLAEDETLLLLDFEDALKEAGFMVLAVTSGKKAVEHLKAAESSIAGIVTDIRFAESPSGWDVAALQGRSTLRCRSSTSAGTVLPIGPLKAFLRVS